MTNLSYRIKRKKAFFELASVASCMGSHGWGFAGERRLVGEKTESSISIFGKDIVLQRLCGQISKRETHKKAHPPPHTSYHIVREL